MIQHLVNVSGGKDSTATYLLAMESGRPFRAVFADTGNEHELTYEYVARLSERTGGPLVETVRADFTARLAAHRAFILANWPAELMAGREGSWQWKPKRGSLVGRPAIEPAPPRNLYRSATERREGGAWRWLLARKPMTPAEAYTRTYRAAELNQPTGNPYLDMCIWKGFFPGRTRQFCTEELKVVPITQQVVIPMLANGLVLQWLGIRAEESAKRAKDPRYNPGDLRGVTMWRPILAWTEEQVWKQHSKHGILPNPLYARHAARVAGKRGRVGCYPCINENKEGIKLIADYDPPHIARIREWEKLVVDASKYGESSFFPAMTDPTDRDRVGLGRYSDIDAIVEWSRTTRGGRQMGMFFKDQPGGGCSHDMGLCERG